MFFGKRQQSFSKLITFFSQWQQSFPRLTFLIGCFALSWLYAATEQITIPLPFSPVPAIIQQVVLFTSVLILGWPAVFSFSLYLLQGILGAPVFAYGLGGFVRFMGPTGGYLVGMLVASAFLAVFKKMITKKTWAIVASVQLAHVIEFTCGLAQLSFFVPSHKVLALGLIPFLFSDFVVKTALITLLLNVYLGRASINSSHLTPNNSQR